MVWGSTRNICTIISKCSHTLPLFKLCTFLAMQLNENKMYGLTTERQRSGRTIVAYCQWLRDDWNIHNVFSECSAIENCATCEADDKDKLTCLTCYVGYELKEGACIGNIITIDLIIPIFFIYCNWSLANLNTIPDLESYFRAL